MSFARERQALEELQSLRDELKPLSAKLDRGERLSTVESRRIAAMADRGHVLRSEILDCRAARAIAAAEAPATPAFGGDDDKESRAFTDYLRTGRVATELRAAGELTGSAGGYLVPPGWWQRLQVARKAFGGVAADFEQTETDTGQSMLWASVDPTNIIGTLIAENTQITDVDYTFGEGTISAYMFTSGVNKVSRQLAQDSAFNIDAFIQARTAEGLGHAEASYAISGTGSSQPLGIITALNAATGLTSGGKFTLSTGKKINVYGPGSGTAGYQQVTELTGNALGPDTVNSLISSVDVAYRGLGAKFYFNDTTLAGMRNVVDAMGQPMYKGLQSSDVNGLTLMDYPVVIDNNIPDLAASTASGVLFGHLASAMVLRRVKGAGILALHERYADFLQVGSIGFERIDIRSNDLRAASVCVAAAS